MALLSWASFDFVSFYTSANEPYVSIYGSWAYVSGRTGWGAEIVSGSAPWERYYLQLGCPARTEVFGQMCAKIYGIGNDYRLFTFWGASEELIVCKALVSGREVEVYRGDPDTTGVYLGSFSVPVPSSEWNVWEFHLIVDGSAGKFEVKLDGNKVFNYSGNTKPGSDTEVVAMRGYNTGGPDYDDFVLVDTDGDIFNTWPNGIHVQVRHPSANGVTNEWSPSAGNNYQCVDEAIASDADFIETNTPNAIDLFDVPNIDASAAFVYGVIVWIYGMYEGDAPCKDISTVLRTHDTNYLSNAKNLNYMGHARRYEVHDKNPNTGEIWTVDEANAIQVGVKSLVAS